MDPRRCLILGLAALSLAGCAMLRPPARSAPALVRPEATKAVEAAEAAAAAPSPPTRAFATMSPIPNPVSPGPTLRPRPPAHHHPPRAPTSSGRTAILAANLEARARSRASNFEGGLQVFDYEPGRVYEVWTAPLRVTALTLGAGETVTAKAAGDTVRWLIGETTSGEGETRRAHVMIKPLTAGLETNLVLTTNRRLYLLQLRSGSPESFNAAVAWDAGAALDLPPAASPTPSDPSSLAVASRQGVLDARFAIRPKGKRPPWTPAAVMTDGTRTYLSFPPQAQATEAPALFAVDQQGAAQMVNYRQRDGLWIVDQVLDRAELRIGGRHPRVVRIERLSGAS